MKVVHLLLLVAAAWWLQQAGAPTVPGDCLHACGGVSVPYPFGLEPQCASSVEFLLSCTTTTTTRGSHARLLLGNIPVRKISVGDSTMVVSLPILYDCYNESGQPANKSDSLAINLSSYPQYTLSDTRNNLTVLGCDTYALVSDKDRMFRTGCISYCSDRIDFSKETACSGLGCCQASIPKGLKTLRIRISSIDGHVSVSQFNPCGLAFVGDTKAFDLSNRTLPSFEDLGKSVDLVLDWMVGWNATCEQAKLNWSSYACGNNTDCENFGNGTGYRCFCRAGHGGNPYSRPGGCQAIFVPVLCITVGASISITWKWRIRKINFRRNRGKHLKQQRVRIFTEAELAKATGNYDESNKLGEGSFGSVYRGRIAGDANTVLAVKKPKDVHKSLIKKEFQDELKAVMRTNRKNVVKLSGICLETRIPLLAYEYVPNGTLFQHLHQNASTILKSWKNRLRIAAEAALALAYMHSCAEPAIVHGNIKSANILMDENYSVKVSDFGTSVLISPEHIHIVATKIEGTLGYIDPEYLTTGKLTIKSDVYSFGVVLMELLTGKKPTSYITKSGEPISIIHCFVSSVKDKTLSDVINFEVSSVKDKTLSDVINFEAANEDEIKRVGMVAEIAVKRLHQSGAKRPAMQEVAQQLAGINPSSTDEEKNEEIEWKVDGETSHSVETSITDEGTSSCLFYLGMNSACSCI
ncbi:wall-associated receptor kinase 3-like isoform X2 [Rhodamnia argentea]|uniref:Wall-associated receptor kinase 3-like isoform X2 n=1 Tax=Rhodamnia argentea TaxID=178133 RepID=A0ABM3GZT3_9MYRT|nr:wall-associated receptor kinase 3-like isoform X2 [Rhodamnia argentea]